MSFGFFLLFLFSAVVSVALISFGLFLLKDRDLWFLLVLILGFVSTAGTVSLVNYANNNYIRADPRFTAVCNQTNYNVYEKDDNYYLTETNARIILPNCVLIENQND